MKKIIPAVIAMVTGIAISAFSLSPVQEGTRLAKKNDSQPKFEKVKADIIIKIYGKDGRLKFRKKMIIAQYTEHLGTHREKENSISYFKEPADDRGNSYLAFDYKKKEDVKYVYLKGIRKAKKVAGASNKLSFFGSDFYNCDMGFPDFNEYTYRFIGKKKLPFKGKMFECMMVEARPKTARIKNENGYGKKISYFINVNNRSMLTLRLEYFNEKMEKIKVLSLKSFVAKKNKKGVTVFYTTGLEMKNVQRGSRTELNFRNLKVEGRANVRTDIFSEQYLSRRWW